MRHQKGKITKSSRRSRRGLLVRGTISGIFAMLMILFIGNTAYADGIGDLIPSGPDFNALGPLAPYVTGFFALVLAVIGILGLIAVVLGLLKVATGTVQDSQMRISQGWGQARGGLILMLVSLVGAGLVLIVLNILVAIFK